MKNLINKVAENRKIGLRVGAISRLLVTLSILREKQKKTDDIILETKLNNEEIISDLEHIDSLSNIVDEMKESEQSWLM